MSQVNVNQTPPSPERPRTWGTALLYILIGALIALVIEGLFLLGLRQNGRELAVLAAGATTTPTPAATATVTATPLGATPTPAGTSAASPTPAVRPPTNPTAMRVTQGSCTRPLMSWSWSGAKGAAGYDVALYNPTTGAVLASNTTLAPRFTQVGAPGQTLALKVRSRNSAGTAPGYFTPADTAHVPPHTTNPTAIQVMTSTTTLTWTWSGAQAASGYDVVLYHYHGGAVVVDQRATVTAPRFSTPARGGTVMYLKVRADGPCASATYYTPGALSAAHA